MLRKRVEPFIPLLSLLSALMAGSLIIALTGKDPFMVYRKMVQATLGSTYGIGQVLFRSTTLILTGLAVALPFKVRLFNIGGEGQLLMGAFAAAVVGMALPAGMFPLAAVTISLLTASTRSLQPSC
jgi:ABC-type uncharacterized transport system permease subunit